MTTADRVNLPSEIIQNIALYLSLPDVCKCQLVCKRWKEDLSSDHFSKAYLHANWNFEIEPEPKGYLNEWQNDWYCYWGDEANETVFRNPPKMWKNGIIHPADYSIEEDKEIKYSHLLHAVYVLDKLSKAGKQFDLDVSAWANEGSSSVEVCIFPWNRDELPSAEDIVDIFHFNTVFYDNAMEKKITKVFQIKANKEDEESDQSEEEEEENADTDNEGDTKNNKPDTESDQKKVVKDVVGKVKWAYISTYDCNIKKGTEFFEWMKKIFFPCKQYCLGCDAMNPTPFFMLSQISPGWVGGIISGLSLT